MTTDRAKKVPRTSEQVRAELYDRYGAHRPAQPAKRRNMPESVKDLRPDVLRPVKIESDQQALAQYLRKE